VALHGNESFDKLHYSAGDDCWWVHCCKQCQDCAKARVEDYNGTTREVLEAEVED
jgi:hypothetical protein